MGCWELNPNPLREHPVIVSQAFRPQCSVIEEGNIVTTRTKGPLALIHAHWKSEYLAIQREETEVTRVRLGSVKLVEGYHPGGSRPGTNSYLSWSAACHVQSENEGGSGETLTSWKGRYGSTAFSVNC